MESVLQIKKECYACGKREPLHKHHVYGASNRKHSERLGYWIWLCPYHHNMSDAGIHFDKDFDLRMKEIAQEHFEANRGDRDAFRSIFGRSYL